MQRTFPHLSTPGRLDRDYDAERRSADERREHRRMAEGLEIFRRSTRRWTRMARHAILCRCDTFFRSAAVRAGAVITGGEAQAVADLVSLSYRAC